MSKWCMQCCSHVTFVVNHSSIHGQCCLWGKGGGGGGGGGGGVEVNAIYIIPGMSTRPEQLVN